MHEESEHDAQIWSRIGLFWETNVFDDHFDVTNAFNKSKCPISYEQSSNIITMKKMEKIYSYCFLSIIFTEEIVTHVTVCPGSSDPT